MNSENWKIKVKRSLNSRKFHYNPSSINPTSYVKNSWVSTPLIFQWGWIEYRSSKNSKVLQKKKRKQNARNWKTHVIQIWWLSPWFHALFISFVLGFLQDFFRLQITKKRAKKLMEKSSPKLLKYDIFYLSKNMSNYLAM